MPGNWEFQSVGTDPATPTPDDGQKGGVFIIESSSAASGVAAMLSGQSAFIKGQELWYIAGRFGAYNLGGLTGVHLSFGALVAGGLGTFLLSDRIECGFIESASNSHWSAQFYDGVANQSLVSSVLLDNLLHDMEMWYDGTNVNFRVDGEPTVSAVAAHLPASALVLGIFHVRAAGDVTLATQGIDKFLALTGLPATYSGTPP